MDEPTPIRHEWTISGLSSVCDRITKHLYIHTFVDGRFYFNLYPNGYDKSCREYVSFRGYNAKHRKYCFFELKISIRNDKKEKNLFFKELTRKYHDNEMIKEFIQRDYLLDGLTHNDQFTLCLEGWFHTREVNDLSNLENKAEWTRDYFDFSPLLSTKSLTLKWTIENVINLFKKSNKSSIELPEIKDSTETGEAIFRSRIELIKNLNNKKLMLFELKTDDEKPILIETSVIDINQQKYHRDKTDMRDTILNGFTKYFNISEEIYSRQSIFADNKFTLLCEITIITDSIRAENKGKYLEILECFEVPSALSMTECTIDGETGEILQNKVVPLLSKIENKEMDVEKLDEFENIIAEQTSTLDQAIIIVNNAYHEHYFENITKIENSIVNTKSRPISGDISIKSNCTELIEKLEDVVNSTIKPVLDQNVQMYTELVDMVLLNQKIILETKQEVIALQSELNKMKQNKKVKRAKMRQIVDRIVALINRIKSELHKVGASITQSKSSTQYSFDISDAPEVRNNVPWYKQCIPKVWYKSDNN